MVRFLRKVLRRMKYSDEWKRERLLRGKQLHFPEHLSEESRTVQAGWFEEAIRSGKAVDVDHAVIRGSVSIRYSVIAEELRVRRSKFLNEVDFSDATAKRTLDFSGTVFCKSTNFARMMAEGDFYGKQTSFYKEAIFYRAVFKASIYFDPVTPDGKTTFTDRVDFRYCSVAGNVRFDRVTFQGDVKFGGADIQDDAFFVSTDFESGASFLALNIGGSAYFDFPYNEEDGRGADFMGACTFNTAKVGQSAFFDRCNFSSGVDFGAVAVGKDCSFMGTTFEQDVSFDGSKIEGKTLFHGTRFSGRAYLVRVTFGSEAHFQDAYLGRNGFIDYYEGTVFDGLASFNGSKFTSGLYLDSEIQTYGTFNRALPERSERRVSSDRFNGPIDLRGCTYDHIHVAAWDFLLEKYIQFLQDKYKDDYEQFIQHPGLFDPQPYVQLEKALRAVADSHGADKVYYKRRVQESKRKSGHYSVLDWVSRILVGYGVGYRELFGWIAAFIIVGMVIFQFPGAVRPAVDIDPAKPIPEPIKAACVDLRDCDVDWLEAAGVSANTFLPIQLPIGETWEPSYVVPASLMKLAGWIIVPLGVAALTGLLQRTAAT